MHRVLFFPVIPGLSIRGEGGVLKEGSVRIFRVKEVDHTFQPSRAKLRAKLGVEAQIGGFGGWGDAQKPAKNAGKQPFLRANKLFGGRRPPDAASLQV